MKEQILLTFNEKVEIFYHILKDVLEQNSQRNSTKQGLTKNQLLILKILYSKGPKNGKELVKFLNISGSAVSKNINYLVKRKLISRVLNSDNRREIKVSILEKGKSIVKDYHKTGEKKMKSILKNLNNYENRMLNLTLDNFIYAYLYYERTETSPNKQIKSLTEIKFPYTKILSDRFNNINENKKNVETS